MYTYISMLQHQIQAKRRRRGWTINRHDPVPPHAWLILDSTLKSPPPFPSILAFFFVLSPLRKPILLQTLSYLHVFHDYVMTTCFRNL